MQIRILAVGQRAPRWVDEAVDDYLKRFPRELSVELLAVRTETRTGDPTRRTEAATATLMAREAERLRARIPPRARVVVLDEHGDDLRTTALARRLRGWQQAGDPVAEEQHDQRGEEEPHHCAFPSPTSCSAMDSSA